MDEVQELIIYGAGELGILALDFCEKCNIKVKAFIDNAADFKKSIKSKNIYKKDYAIFHPLDKKIETFKSIPIYIAIATLSYSDIENQLQIQGWKNIKPFYFLTKDNKYKLHPLSNGWQIKNLNTSLLKKIQQVENMLKDELSVKHYRAFLKWHNGFIEDQDTKKSIHKDQRYVIKPLINYLVKNNNNFVDIGSHIGESVLKLHNAGIEFKEYNLYEPDYSSCIKLIQNVEKLKLHNSKLSIHLDVLGKDEILVRFYPGLGYSSQICSSGNEIRKQKTLDNYHLKPSLIKLHTEGSELDILAGAVKTIKKYRPAIASAIYHNDKGVVDIFMWAKANLIDYNIYLRLHNFQGCGAFIYCIPN